MYDINALFSKKCDFEVKFEEIKNLIISKLTKIEMCRLLRFKAQVFNFLNMLRIRI